MDRWNALAIGLVATTLGAMMAAAEHAAAAETEGGHANWFATVAEANRLAEEERKKDPRPAPRPAPPPPDAGGKRPDPPVFEPPRPAPHTLDGLITTRNRLIDDERVLDLIRQLAQGRKPTQRELGSLSKWFQTYFRIRALVPSSRRDPNLAGTTQALVRAAQRKDFMEARILGAVCHMFAGNDDAAAKLLDEASRLLHENQLNPSPFGQDCCLAWLLLGQPERVKGYVGVLTNKKLVPERLMTSFQATLVAMHEWQTYQFNDAKKYFNLAIDKAQILKADDLSEGAQSLAADAALFFLVAGNPGVRNPTQGARLLARIPDDNRMWRVLRARAALSASKAADAATDGTEAELLWEEAVKELDACRQDSLPTLDKEIDAQLAKYRGKQLWYRERPPVAKPD